MLWVVCVVGLYILVSVFSSGTESTAPAGFGRFVLEVMNPNIRDLKPAEVLALSTALGTLLRRIWVHI